MWSLTFWLTTIWALTILYGEMVAFWVPPIWSCSWPHQVKGLNDTSDYVKIAVIADPQLMDRTSLNLPPKSLALEIVQFYTDVFMRRAFLSSILPCKPDAVIFLGDYMDGGPILSNNEWQESISRFKHIFDLNMLQKSTNNKVYFLSGNHDIGYAAFLSQSPEVIRRYEQEFGARNFKFTLGKVDFVAVDAQTLDGNPKDSLTASTWNFASNVNLNVSRGSSPNARVLLTHIPLYRPDWTPCGPHRSSPIINQRISRSRDDQQIRYQNYVSQKSTEDLLNLIKPALILSGHDHDQCTVAHAAKYGSVVEHTVGTVSWQQGNLFPSFMLLSASNRGFPEEVLSSQLCFLPVQLYIYIWYLVLFMITLIAALYPPTAEAFFSRCFGLFRKCSTNLLSFTVFGGVGKEKNEDENCEYEMLWDADGSIHMMKKASKAPPKISSDGASVERGNAVMRVVAKRQSGHEENGSTTDVSVNVDSLDTALASSRAKRSRTESVIRRLLRMVRVLAVVAVVNVPLYLMLLFKDWIDN